MQEKKMKYQRYKRGQIVLIDFSPSMGSELRGKHFAIVITKKDSPNNGVLTVIPLSSKEKPYYLDIGNFVSKQVYPQLLNITRELYTALANLDSSDENEYNVEDVQGKLQLKGRVILCLETLDLDVDRIIQVP